MAKTNHSDKAITTLTAMNTTPEGWKHADVIVKEERRMIFGEVTCPDCLGGKVVARDADGVIVPPPDRKAFGDWYAYNDAEREYRKLATGSGMLPGRGNCGRCKCTRGRMRGHSTGKVPGMVEADVLVAYVQWPKGTSFDSRFCGSSRCGLCNKSIMKSGLVPCVGTGPDGAIHGMWVGQDCAKKFLPGVTTFERSKAQKKLETVYEDAV